MASNGTGQRPGNSSFLTYQVGQRAKTSQTVDPVTSAGASPVTAQDIVVATTPPAQQETSAAEPSTITQRQPLTLDGPEMVRTQPSPLRLSDPDRFYRNMGRLPTAADLAAAQFATQFRAAEGRAATRPEVMAHMYRRPDLLPQVSKDYEVS
jgi:hypothetical protein